MNIGVLGTGIVGRTLGTRLVHAGHQVVMGSRSASNAAAAAWAEGLGEGASYGTFADAARFAQVIFNCTAGAASLAALLEARVENLEGKILVDVANPLDFSQGGPPTLTVCNTDSLGEQIQRAFPGLRVVKALNTMNAEVMVDPALVQGEHQLLMCGDDSAAKAEAARLFMRAFGWRPQAILDLGDITAARGMEMVLPLWIRLRGMLRTPHFNFLVSPPTPAGPAGVEAVVTPPVPR